METAQGCIFTKPPAVIMPQTSTSPGGMIITNMYRKESRISPELQKLYEAMVAGKRIEVVKCKPGPIYQYFIIEDFIAKKYEIGLHGADWDFVETDKARDPNGKRGNFFMHWVEHFEVSEES